MTFVPRIVYGDLDLTDEPYLVELGFSLGNGVTVYEAISSLMLDGSFMSSPGAGNREGLTLSVIVEAADSAESAPYAAALELETGKAFNTLTFYPGDGFGAATVLETFPAQVTHDWDQTLDEAGLRRYILDIPALPFGRSEETESFVWSGAGVELDPLSSTSTWTTVAGSTGTSANADGAGSQLNLTGTTTIRQTLAVDADEYLWLKTGNNPPSSVKVNGVAVSSSSWKQWTPSGARTFIAVPCGGVRGTKPTVEMTFTGGGTLYEFYTVSYPSPVTIADDLKPRGIGVVDVIGSARTACRISFTAPAGGAFVYTAPDPNVSIRERGVGEVVFGVFNVTDANGAEVNAAGQVMWFPQGTHSAQVGLSAPQPLELNPNGVWPTLACGQATWDGGSIAAGAYQFAYPSDAKAAITFYDTTGAKNIISPSPSLPEGYHGGAAHHEVHALHPGRCGFAVLDQNGDPITATVTYYPRWWSHAAQ